jgi:DNA-directed RNA polymerase subunit alpha
MQRLKTLRLEANTMEAIPLPNRAKIENLSNNKYKMVLEPLYPGFGVTVGNALRRVLLSSMPGAAATAVKIKYVDHEFSTVPNVKEDVIQIILQLKQLRFISHSSEPVRLQLKVKGEKVITAEDIQETDQVKVVNKDLHIATLEGKTSDFEMELIVEQGRGYAPVESREHQKPEIGMIALDAVFTPVKSVYFDISNVRVGQFTNYDKLEVTMETDGTISGADAINISANILVDHFSMLFAQNDGVVPATPVATYSEDMVDMEKDATPMPENEITMSTLSTRAKNALIKNHITSIEDLKKLSSEEIENIEGLGKKTITEILEFISR